MDGTGSRSGSKGESQMLEPLFDAELDHQPGMPPLTSQGDGALIGSGDGAVHGPKLTGKLEWTLFEQPRQHHVLDGPGCQDHH